MEAKGAMSILTEANDLIYGQREKDYGPPRRHLTLIADFWESYLVGKGLTIGLTATDVAYMLALLKLARLAHDPTHRDSMVDAAGYIGLAERVQS